MSNARNTRTTHPRKQARRDRATDRFVVNAARRNDRAYMAAKSTEAVALGLSAWFLAQVDA